MEKIIESKGIVRFFIILPIFLFLFKVYQPWVYISIFAAVLLLFFLRIRCLEKKMLIKELLEKGIGIALILGLYVYYTFFN
ncbi:hypothetical protein EGI24_18505 [Lacihabitans sp. CS3-21]|nr:hypothetical protein [Lacihabitans sp. CS3-21]